MYKVYSDGFLIYDGRIEDYKIFNATLRLELNKAGEFNFSIYPDHPNFNRLSRLKSIITVYQDNYLIFRGRILNDKQGFYNEKQVSCEGELAFLIDSIQRPYDFLSGSNHTTITDLFTFFINNHNSQVEADKQFIIGNITVTDSNNYIVRANSEYSTTWGAINDKLIDSFGGYLWVRHETNGNYIDYLSDFNTISNQPITFGKNLLDVIKSVKGEEVATAIIPLGAKGDETSSERLTIKSVNYKLLTSEPDDFETNFSKYYTYNGAEYIQLTAPATWATNTYYEQCDYVYNSEAVALHGWIYKINIWDDVTDPTNLLNKANALLSDLVNLSVSIDVSAADLSSLEDFNSFHLGVYVSVDSTPHNLDANFLVKKLQINLLKPTENKLTLGANYKTLTEQTSDISKTIENAKIEIIDSTNVNLDGVIAEIERQTQSLISQTSDQIITQVNETHYLKDETDAMISSVETRITQNQDSVEIQFNSINKDIEDVQSGADAKFQEISNYIRFEDGEIELGGRTSQFKQRMTQTKNSFYDDNVEVAYIGNKKMYITDGEFTNSLRVGKFAFVPGARGNLKFKKVVE